MSRLNFILVTVVVWCSFFSCRLADGNPRGVVSEPDALTPVPINEVRLEDSFWLPRLLTQAETLVPFALDKTIPAVENLRKTARFLSGDTTDLPFPHRFVSSDLYKVMEGAAYLLSIEEDPELERRLDEIIDVIAAAQQDDGYLYVAHITGVSKDHDHWGGGGMGDKPYSFVLHSHELYNVGHMYEAAIAYYLATGKQKWLDVAEKSARHINQVFFEGSPDYNGGQPVNQAPGHEEIELALVKLYRVTGERLYLEMAKRFLDIRGRTYVPEGDGYLAPTYAQQHLPVVDQREPVGHAVRATYLYSAMADVAALVGTDEYDAALHSIWRNIVDTRMHITGGLGAVHGIEGFGPPYHLPNAEAYNETCAAVGNVLFSHRMFLLTRDAAFMDVAEVALLNGALAGVNIEGNRFFYVNPLEADGTTGFNHNAAGRAPWFNTACCPSNLARTIPQVTGMMYSHVGNEIYTSFYAGSDAVVHLENGSVSIRQQTDYPFDGRVHLTINPEREQSFSLKLRIPGWARTDRFVPGNLYQFADTITDGGSWQIRVNGAIEDIPLDKGFAGIDRNWRPGDEVELTLPMDVRFNRAHENVEANRGRIAVTRGPLVYCAEGVDNGGPVQRISIEGLPDRSAISTETIDSGVLQNFVKVSFPSNELRAGEGRTHQLAMIPYYAWNNRGNGSMIVWIPNADR
jgi:DUF1680 family protein